MSHSEYLSSPKVIFSDRGSIAFGFVVILAMIALSLALFLCKFQKSSSLTQKKNPSHRKASKTLLLLKHPYLFRSSKFTYLLFFMNSKKLSSKKPLLLPHKPSPQASSR